MFSALRVVEAPPYPPVAVDRLRRHARIDHTSEDEEIELYIRTATERTEAFLGRALLTQSLTWYVREQPPGPSWPVYPMQELLVLPLVTQPMRWGHKPVELPRSPVQAVTSIVVTDRCNNTRTLDPASDYYLDLQSDPAVIRFTGNASIHTTDGVETSFVAGYGAAPSAVPAGILNAILLIATSLYEHRGDDDGEMPKAAMDLLWMYRVQSYA